MIDQAIELGWQTICISGGEPFLLPHYLRRASEICARRNVGLVVQTNGFWGRQRHAARSLLESLRGITQLGFSIDKAHLAEIGIDPLLGALQAAEEAGVPSLTASISYQTQQEESALRDTLGQRFPRLVFAAWPIVPIGRAAEHPELRKDYFSVPWLSLQRGCGAQLRLSPIVHPNGDLHLCYRTLMVLESRDPAILGNVQRSSLRELLKSTNNRVAAFLVAFGGGGLGYLLRGSSHESALNTDYQGVCHFCHSVCGGATLAHVEEVLADDAVFERVSDVVTSGAATTVAPQFRIRVCNGRNCGREYRNYSVIHYLLNQLTERGQISRCAVETVDCLRLCGNGPNFFIDPPGIAIQHVDQRAVDALVERICEPVAA